MNYKFLAIAAIHNLIIYNSKFIIPKCTFCNSVRAFRIRSLSAGPLPCMTWRRAWCGPATASRMLAINTPKHHQPADALAHLGPNFRLVTVDVDTDISACEGPEKPALQPPALQRGAVYQPGGGGEAARRFCRPRRWMWCRWKAPSWPGMPSCWAASESADLRVPPLVLRAHNLEHTIWQMLAGRERNPLKSLYLRTMAARLERFERRHLRAVRCRGRHHRRRCGAAARPGLPRAGGVHPRRRRPEPASSPTPPSSPSRAPCS